MTNHQYLIKARQGDTQRASERDPAAAPARRLAQLLSGRATAARRSFPAVMNNTPAASIHPCKDGPP